MEQTDKNIITGVITVSLFVLLFGFMMILVVFKYLKRKRNFLLEKQMLEARYKQEQLQAQIEIQEQTFNTISREIHDNVGQILSLVKVQLNIIGENERIDLPLVNEAKENISKAMNDLRDIAKSLNSEKFEQTSLHLILKEDIERIGRSRVLKVYQEVQGAEQYLGARKKLILFRMIQESFQNIIKHAEASSVIIKFCYGETSLRISILDNGRGFDVQKETANGKGLGLQNILSRTSLIRGTAGIESSPGRGTTITLNIPYE